MLERYGNFAKYGRFRFSQVALLAAEAPLIADAAYGVLQPEPVSQPDPAAGALMSFKPIRPAPCDPTYATCRERSFEKACCKLRFHEVAYGRRRFGSTAVMAHGLLAPAGVVLSGESQRTVPPLGSTGPAMLQFTPEVYCTLAVV